MLRLRSYVRRYLGFSRKETNGFLILIPLIALIILFPGIYKNLIYPSETTTTDDKFAQLLADEIQSMINDRKTDKSNELKVVLKLTPKIFDPNIADIGQLELMGLSKKLSRTIDNYRKKGGVFRVKNDLSKIYGLNQEIFQQLYQYIDLPEKLSSYKNSHKAREEKKSIQPEIEVKDLNSATQQDLMAIKGIGEVLSKRIISFRSGLGGFHSLEQLKEVYALEDTVVSRLQEHFDLSDSNRISQLDLTTSTRIELSDHPYISQKLAKIIIAYRDQHKFQSINQLSNIKVITDSIYQKIAPYIFISDFNP